MTDPPETTFRDLIADLGEASAELIQGWADSFDGHRVWLSEFNRALVCELRRMPGMDESLRHRPAQSAWP